MTELTNILNKIKTELHLSRDFEIRDFLAERERLKHMCGIYYNNKLVQTISKEQISNVNFNELIHRIHINLFLSKIFLKKTICTLKRKK